MDADSKFRPSHHTAAAVGGAVGCRSVSGNPMTTDPNTFSVVLTAQEHVSVAETARFSIYLSRRESHL